MPQGQASIWKVASRPGDPVRKWRSAPTRQDLPQRVVEVQPDIDGNDQRIDWLGEHVAHHKVELQRIKSASVHALSHGTLVRPLPTA